MAGEAFGLVRGTGIKARVDGSMMPPAYPDDPPPGEHLWTLMVTYRVDPTQREEVMLDTENLIGVSPPLCAGCIQVYTPAIAAAPCPGDPDA